MSKIEWKQRPCRLYYVLETALLFQIKTSVLYENTFARFNLATSRKIALIRNHSSQKKNENKIASDFDRIEKTLFQRSTETKNEQKKKQKQKNNGRLLNYSQKFVPLRKKQTGSDLHGTYFL